MLERGKRYYSEKGINVREFRISNREERGRSPSTGGQGRANTDTI
jgi:hypothetical protein